MTAPTEGSRWRRWRRSRPFYGGLLMILSALELFFSANLNPGALQVHFGPTGFLSYVIPIVMLLCGVLTWVSPSQRLFYGILGALTAVYSLIGLNLGGFFLGLLLGVIGGALAAAWTHLPEPPPPPETTDEDAFDERYVGQQSTAVYGTPIEAEPVDEEAPQPSGVLTDSLPTSLRSPLHEPPDTSETGGAGDADSERPPAPGEGQHRLRYGGALFAVLVLAVVSVYVAGGSSPAAAAPCAPIAKKTMADRSPSASPSTNKKAPVQTRTDGASASPSASPSPAPSPSASPSEGGGNIVTDIVGGIVDFWHNLFGGGKKEADPGASSPSPSAPSSAPASPAGPPASPAPGPTKSAPTASPTPSNNRPKSAVPCTPSPTGPAKRAAVDPGQPAVSRNTSLVLTSTQEMHGLNFDGVVELPTKNANGTAGSVRVLKFTMSAVSNTPFEMHTPGGPKLLETTSDRLTLSGNVEFFTTKLVGKLQLIPGLPPIPLELTFTPDSPPPLTLPEMTFKDVQVDLVYVKADALTADNFDLRFAA
jgi:hypothetical protein